MVLGSTQNRQSAHEAFALAGQVALVTGAASGLGRSCALALGAAGCSVVVNHLPGDESAGRDLSGEIEAAGGRAFAFPADVSREDDVEAMFAAARSRFGTVHILVNNAGIQSGARFQDMTLAQWRKVMAVNLDGQFLCARAAVREMLRRGPQPELSSATGKIICMSSVARGAISEIDRFSAVIRIIQATRRHQLRRCLECTERPRYAGAWRPLARVHGQERPAAADPVRIGFASENNHIR